MNRRRRFSHMPILLTRYGHGTFQRDGGAIIVFTISNTLRVTHLVLNGYSGKLEFYSKRFDPNLRENPRTALRQPLTLVQKRSPDGRNHRGSYCTDTVQLRGRSWIVVVGILTGGCDAMFYENSSSTTSPPSTTFIGRPSGLMFSWEASTPRLWHVDRRKSATATGRSWMEEPSFAVPPIT